MTLVAHSIITSTTPPSGTQPGDFVVVMVNPRVAGISGSTTWLRHIGLGVYVGTYPSGGTIPATGTVIVLVYRPDPGGALTAQVWGRSVPIGSSTVTLTADMPAVGDIWGIWHGLSQFTSWGGSYNPAVVNTSRAVAYARVANTSSGSLGLTGTFSGSPIAVAVGIYYATGQTPDPLQWTQAIEGQAVVRIGGQDVSASVISLEVVDELDGAGPVATITVDRSTLHPDLPGSPLQLAAPVEIIGRYRPVSSTQWQEAPMLIGRVGAIDPSRHEMTVQVYDASESLLSTWLEGEYEATGTQRLAQRLQQLVLQAGLTVPIYEGSIITVSGAQRFGRRPVLEMMRESAAYCGGSRIRWRYDHAAQCWRLVLYTPDRAASTPTYTFGPNDILDLGSARLGLEDIRNVVQVVYGPPTSRTMLTAEDPASIAQYGRRVARIEEASDSVVDTQAEAQALAAAVLADLAQPMRGARLSLPWAPFVRVNDVIRVEPDGYVLRAAVQGGVSRVRHRLTPNEARTEVEIQGNRNPGLYRYWLSRESGRTGVVSSTANWRPSVPITPSSLQAVATPRGILVTWPEERDPHYVETLIYFGSNFSSTTLWGRVSGTSVLITSLGDGTPLTPDTTYYVRIAHRYRDGRVSPTSSTVSVTATAVVQGNSVAQSGLASALPTSDYADISGASITFTVSSPSSVLLHYRLPVYIEAQLSAAGSGQTTISVSAYARLVQTAGPSLSLGVMSSFVQFRRYDVSPPAGTGIGGDTLLTATHSYDLSPGTYTFKLQAYASSPNQMVALYRGYILGAYMVAK